MSTRAGNVLKQGERFGGKVRELDQFSRGGKLPLCKRLRMGESYMQARGIIRIQATVTTLNRPISSMARVSA
jgi:hypothetical protein